MAIARHKADFQALLQCGVQCWNEFRLAHSSFLVMNCMQLAKKQIPNIDLHCVVLMESDLRDANLSCANLERSILRKSDFRGSDLHSANLGGADLCRADFSFADLRGADLTSAFLERTNLTGADLSTARGLTLAQINRALGDDQTKLPVGLERPPVWSLRIVSGGSK